MSRSGYCDDIEQQDLAMWRGRVMSAIRGKRGQQLLKNLLEALDALPNKRLIAGEFVEGEECCTLGALGMRQQLPGLHEIDSEQHDYLARVFNVSSCLIQEIEFENDEGGFGFKETPERRWERMREWVAKQIK